MRFPQISSRPPRRRRSSVSPIEVCRGPRCTRRRRHRCRPRNRRKPRPGSGTGRPSTPDGAICSRVSLPSSVLAARSHRRRDKARASQAAHLFEAEQARLRQRAAGLLPAEADELARHDEREDERELELAPDLVRDVPAVHLFFYFALALSQSTARAWRLPKSTAQWHCSRGGHAAYRKRAAILSQDANYRVPPSTYEQLRAVACVFAADARRALQDKTRDHAPKVSDGRRRNRKRAADTRQEKQHSLGASRARQPGAAGCDHAAPHGAPGLRPARGRSGAHVPTAE